MDRERSTQKNMEPEELLEEFGDLFQEMEGRSEEHTSELQSLEILYADIRFAMDDIYDEMERLEEYLDGCAAALRAYSR